MACLSSGGRLVPIGLLLLLLPVQCSRETHAQDTASLFAAVRILGVEQFTTNRESKSLSITIPGMESEADVLEAEITVMLKCDHGDRIDSCDQRIHADPSLLQIVEVRDNGKHVDSCPTLPCTVVLQNVSTSLHHIIATADGFGLREARCETRFSVAMDQHTHKWWEESEQQALPGEDEGESRGHADDAVPDGVRAEIDSSAGATDDKTFVAILFPPDDFCMNDAQHAYISVAVSDGFFKRPEAKHIGAKLDVETWCFTTDGHTATPATAWYDPKEHGQLFVCDTSHAHVNLRDGYATQLDADATASSTSQHDCPPGSTCKHDLDEGFMMDVWLLAPQAGQGIADLVAGMRRARFYLVDSDGVEVGGSAYTTYFVDHGASTACSSAASHRASEEEDGLAHQCAAGACDVRAERELVNVAVGATAMQSSTSGGDAEAAVDGDTLGWCAAEWKERCVHVAKTALEVHPFWEVDLGQEWRLEEIAVWGELVSSGSYPALVLGAQLLPMSVMLMDAEREVTGEFLVDEGEQRAVHWLSLLGDLPPTRFVRIQLLPDADSANEVPRQLALREVQAFALLDPRDGGVAELGAASVCWRGNLTAEGRCVCESGWFGRRCDANMLLSTVFMPPPAPTQRGGCVFEGCSSADPMFDGALFDETLQKLTALQHPAEDCADADAISFFFENRGLAATVMHIAGLVTYAWMQGRPLVISKQLPWIYTDASNCPSQDFECYFKPWSACPPPIEGSFLAGGRDNLVRDFNWMVPPELAHKGVFWWRTVVLAYLFQLQDDVVAELDVEGVKRRIGFEHPIISMHVRRGDACHTSLRKGRCLSLLENVAGVRAMSVRYGISRVFVATDSPTVVDELRGLAPELTFVSIDNFDRSKLEDSILQCKRQHPDKLDDGTTLDDGCTGNDAWLEHRLGKGQVGRKELALATLLDLTLMAHADAFVGHFASNLSRMAFLLAVAHHRRVIPFWSVDGPWCYHWRMCCDVQLDGSSGVC